MYKILPVAFLLCGLITAQDNDRQEDGSATPRYQEHQVAGVPWRNLGPANMGGRITDIAVPAKDSSIWYVASAGGGLWKTVNRGTTWTAQFQHQPTVSIGDVAVAPSNSDVVWVGTGEENARNSVSFGDGVYKSTDGGSTWKHMGLEKTFQIGHISIHPKNENIVFVAALGRLWGPNPERGIYRTRDGGNSWQRVFYIDENTGCIDLRIDPNRPYTVYAAMYERKRDMFDTNDPAVRFGEGSGFFRSDDGGATWKKLTRGLPTCKWGRSGFSLFPKEPGTLFAIIETERSGWGSGTEQARQATRSSSSAYMGISGKDGENGALLSAVTPGGPSAKAGFKTGDLITKIGDKNIAAYADLIAAIRGANGGDKVEIHLDRDGAEQVVELTYGTRGGTGDSTRRSSSSRAPFSGRLGGQTPNIQEQQGDKGYETGGIFRSDDHGETWTRINSLTDRPFYYSVIVVDPSDDRNIYSCGVSFYASHDGGKSFRPANRGIHVDFHATWVNPDDPDHLLLGCDGGINVSYDQGRTWELLNNFEIGQFYHVGVDNAVPYNIYGGLQDNGTWGGPSRTRSTGGIAKDDWRQIYGGDGFRAKVDPNDPNIVFATSQNGNLGMVNLATGRQSRVQKSGTGLKFNWDTPFFLSPHNPRILYFAGNHAFRSLNRGERSERMTEKTLGLTERGTATAMAESPVQAGLLYTGTDDGGFWRSTDNGRTWQELHDRISGLRGPRYVSSIQPSRFVRNRVYATFDGHRSDDNNTYVFVSEDAGDTWSSLIGNLADEPVHICIEDPTNRDLLYLGTEFCCYISLDRGQNWHRLGAGFPTVAVRDLAIQNREQDLVAATHGRGIWVLDIEPLRQLTKEIADVEAHLFKPANAIAWQMQSQSQTGSKNWRAPNPSGTAQIYALFNSKPEQTPVVTIHDITGKQVGSIRGRAEVGLQRFVWDGRVRSQSTRGGRRSTRSRGGSRAAIGSYSARLKWGEAELIQPFLLHPDPQNTNDSSASNSRRQP